MRTLLLSAFLIFCGSAAFAQWYPVPRGPKALEVGYSYAIGTADFTYQATRFNEGTGVLTDTSFTDHITSSTGFGGFVGYYFPVARLGTRSRLAISATYMYNAYIWEGGSLNYTINGQTVNPDVEQINPTYATVEMALPVGADYKWGSDAVYSKAERLCYSLGAGVYPSMDMTMYREVGGFKFHMRPYLRAEAGFFAGLCFKLRATYIMGKMDYISYGHDNPGDFEETKFTSKGTTVLSLVIMPMSWKFAKGGW